MLAEKAYGFIQELVRPSTCGYGPVSQPPRPGHNTPGLLIVGTLGEKKKGASMRAEKAYAYSQELVRPSTCGYGLVSQLPGQSLTYPGLLIVRPLSKKQVRRKHAG